MNISYTPLLKTILPPLIYQPFPFNGKILNPLFLQKFRKLKPSPFYNGGRGGGRGGQGGSNYEDIHQDCGQEKPWKH